MSRAIRASKITVTCTHCLHQVLWNLRPALGFPVGRDNVLESVAPSSWPQSMRCKPLIHLLRAETSTALQHPSVALPRPLQPSLLCSKMCGLKSLASLYQALNSHRRQPYRRCSA